MTCKKIRIVFLAFILSLAIAAGAYADVTVERFVKSGGVNGMGASEHNEKELIKGLKKRVESTRKFTGGFLSKITGTKKTTVIYDINNDLVRTLDNSKKTYTERTITLPEDSSGGKSVNAGDDDASEKDGGDSEARIVKNELKLRDTGRKKKMNGFPCRLYTLTWLVVAENVRTGERTKSLMTGDYWTTPETRKIKALKSEEARFNLAYLKKMGLEMNPEDFKRMGLSILGSLAGTSGGELKKEMSRMKGYPVVTSIKWESESSKKTVKQDGAVDIKHGVGGLLGSLSKKMAKKDRGEKKPVFESYTEIKSIDTSGVGKEEFSVPEGYKKKKGLW